MTHGPLYRAEVVPFPKVRPATSCNHSPHTPTNPCISCRNSNNRTKGLRAQKKAAKAMKMGRVAFRSQAGNEERWRDKWRAEMKSGKQINPIGTAFLVFENWSLRNKAHGDIRPFCAVVMPDDFGNDGVVMLRVSTWRREIAPLLEDDS